jgi:hypothetical protein
MTDERENQEPQDQQENEPPVPDPEDCPTNNPGTRDYDGPFETK